MRRRLQNSFLRVGDGSVSANKDNATYQLQQIITKARIHLYKPIQIAEILYRHRIGEGVDLSDPSTYRTQSRRWRDEVSEAIYNAHSTSSAGYQDDLFNKQLPPSLMVQLGNSNREGEVEIFIYSAVKDRLDEVQQVLPQLTGGSDAIPDIAGMIDLFSDRPGLKRSVDKIFEIIVYALVSIFISQHRIETQIRANNRLLPSAAGSKALLEALLGDSNEQSAVGRVFRMGVANAADAGIDMWSNFGPAFQTKHIDLDVDQLASIVEKFTGEVLINVVRTIEPSIAKQLVDGPIQIGSKHIYVLTIKDLQAILNELATQHKGTRDEFRSIIESELSQEFGGHEGSSELNAIAAERGYW
jgi:hypothetical protein